MAITIPANLAANDTYPESFADDVRQGIIDLRDRAKPLPVYVMDFNPDNIVDWGTGWPRLQRLVNTSNNENLELQGFIPDDFSSLDTFVLCIIADATNTFTYNLEVGYGAVGENITNHTNSSTGATVALTANQMAEIDISGLLASLAAGDVLAVMIEGDNLTGGNVYFAGFRALYVGA